MRSISGCVTCSGASVANPEPRVRNPRGEGGRLRTELLEAAADLMARHGSIDKVGVRTVAAAAGVSPTAVYGHFEDHSELLWASVQYCFDEFTAAMAEAEQAGSDPFDRLALVGEAYLRFATDNRGKYRVMFSNRVEMPDRPERVGALAFDNLVRLVGDVLRARGDDRDGRFVAVQVWTWAHGIADLMGSVEPADEWPHPDDLFAEMRERLELVPRSTVLP